MLTLKSTLAVTSITQGETTSFSFSSARSHCGNTAIRRSERAPGKLTCPNRHFNLRKGKLGTVSSKTCSVSKQYRYNSGAPAAEGRQAEPHTHIRKLKGTHELIFSCVSWLAVLLVGAYARRRRRRRRWWSRATWRPQLTRKPKRGFSFRGLSL